MNAQTKIELPADAQLRAALAKALPELGSVHKNKNNPAFKSSYADLAAVIGALEPLAKHGLWFRQVPVECDNGIALETFYIHESGAEMTAGVTRIPVDRGNAQGYGSAQTYCRRYALQTAFGLAADDDDGNAAAKAPPKAEYKPERLTDGDLTKIIALCEAVGGNQAGLICNAYKIGALPELTPSQAKAVIGKLSDKLADRARAETNQQAETVDA